MLRRPGDPRRWDAGSGPLIDPKIDDFRDEERKIARAFYSYEMWREFSEGPEAHVLTGARMTEIETVSRRSAL